MSKSRSSRN